MSTFLYTFVFVSWYPYSMYKAVWTCDHHQDPKCYCLASRVVPSCQCKPLTNIPPWTNSLPDALGIACGLGISRPSPGVCAARYVALYAAYRVIVSFIPSLSLLYYVCVCVSDFYLSLLDFFPQFFQCLFGPLISWSSSSSVRVYPTLLSYFRTNPLIFLFFVVLPPLFSFGFRREHMFALNCAFRQSSVSITEKYLCFPQKIILCLSCLSLPNLKATWAFLPKWNSDFHTMRH